MILKIKGKDGWSFFDAADEISYRYVSDDESLVLRDDALDATLKNQCNRIEIWLWDKWVCETGDGIKQIISNTTTYILNNDGKTIEKIGC